MLDGLLCGLIVAFILNLFGFGTMFCTFFEEIFHITISIPSYYMIFAIIGILNEIINRER